MDFIKRNSPIFIIGGITVLVFLLIIVLGQNKPPTNGPLLQEVPESQLVTPQAYILGKQNSPVTLTEFSDFGCPACAVFGPMIKELVKKYPEELRVVYRHFPLPQHKNAELAAQAAQIAGEQGKFWEYGDILFANQEKFERADLIAYAEQLSLDVEKFTKELDSGTFATIVNEDIKEGKALGINSTPTFFLNGKALAFKTFKEFQDQVSAACEKAKEEATDNLPEDTTDQKPPLVIEPIREATMSQAELDKKYGVLKIDYTDTGFKAKNANATLGQLVRWTNKSKSVLKLEQIANFFAEFTNPVEIQPGGTLEQRLYKSGYWAYRDANTLISGSIQIADPVASGSGY